MLIIASDSGKVRALEDPDESDKVITILDLRMENEEICTNGERGVQSLVLHPDFDENFLIYLFYMGYREVRMSRSQSFLFARLLANRISLILISHLVTVG